MANNFLTPQMVTREALRVLHQKSNFVGSITRDYDKSYAQDGAKIGNNLKIRLPNQYVIRNGATLNTQDTVENSVNLTVSNQMGVDMNFTSADLTMNLDDFSKRVIAPAMSVLAANIEATVIAGLLPTVYNSIWNNGSATSYNQVLAGRAMLNRALAPDDDRTANVNSQDMVDLVTDTKTLFTPTGAIGDNFKKGVFGEAAGFEFVENTLWPNYTRGASNTAYTTNTTALTNGQNTLTVATGSGAMNVGDVFTVAGIYAVHPESKAQTSQLQQFVVTAAYAGGAGTVSFAPAINVSGAAQNVIAATTSSTAAIVFFGTASTSVGTSLLYQEGAFAFATADLVMPKGIDWGAREVFDGISLRIVRNYDIVNDKFPCRVDVLFGYAALRPQLACRLHNH